ncbi:MAG: hypothetical protein AAF471_08625 [Myxococcota bacterium]
MIAGTLEHKGMQRGLQQEREEVAVRLIETGMDTADIAKATSLPQQRIQELRAPNGTPSKG